MSAARLPKTLVLTTDGFLSVQVLAALDHGRRLNSVVDAGAFGNGWGGPGGSFCDADGSVATFVGIYKDQLHSSAATNDAVAWYRPGLQSLGGGGGGGSVSVRWRGEADALATPPTQIVPNTEHCIARTRL